VFRLYWPLLKYGECDVVVPGNSKIVGKNWENEY
jgi:hypothetical protein